MNEKFTIKGEWFLPSNKENRIHGTLTYHPNEGAKLELYGRLDGELFFGGLKDEEIILGISSKSKEITLYRCGMTNSGGATLVQGRESGKPGVVYSILYTFIGCHAERVDDIKFNRISAEIFNLDEWVAISGFKIPMPTMASLKKHEIKTAYKLPKSIEFKINEHTKGRFNFVANHPSLNRYQKSIKITQRTQLQFDLAKEQKLEEVLAYIFTFQNFLTLALYKSTYPVYIKLHSEGHKETSHDGKEYYKAIELFFSSRNIKKDETPKYDFDMIFDYRRIRKNFPRIIRNWYAKYELLKPAFDLVFEQFYNGNVFTENTFLNLAQSAETFHARLHDRKRISPKKFNKMKEDILNITPKKYHEWLNDQFNFGNGLNLHIRLTELTDKYSNDILDKILGDKTEFIKQVKTSRNYYTHYAEESRKKAKKGGELFILSEKLKLLLVCSFLIQAGFKKDELSKNLENVKWRLFNHLADWRS